MLGQDIAASSLKMLCKNINSEKSYGKTNETFVLRLWENTGGLNFVWPVICVIYFTDRDAVLQTRMTTLAFLFYTILAVSRPLSNISMLMSWLVP